MGATLGVGGGPGLALDRRAGARAAATLVARHNTQPRKQKRQPREFHDRAGYRARAAPVNPETRERLRREISGGPNHLRLTTKKLTRPKIYAGKKKTPIRSVAARKIGVGIEVVFQGFLPCEVRAHRKQARSLAVQEPRKVTERFWRRPGRKPPRILDRRRRAKRIVHAAHAMILLPTVRQKDLKEVKRLVPTRKS